MKEQAARAEAGRRGRRRCVLSAAPAQGVDGACCAALSAASIDAGQAAARSAAERRWSEAESAAVTPDASPTSDFRRIVVKVGSSLLVDRARGRLKHAWLAALAEDIARLARARRRRARGLVRRDRARAHRARPVRRRALKLEESQAAAAVGQIALARHLGGGAGPSRHHRRADPAHPRRHRGAPPLPQRPRHDRRRCWSCAPCRSSTRTTRSRRARSATATTTASPPASRP